MSSWDVGFLFKSGCVCVCVWVHVCIQSETFLSMNACIVLFFSHTRGSEEEILSVWRILSVFLSSFSNKMRIKVTELLLKYFLFSNIWMSVSHVYGIFECLISLLLSLRVCAFMYMQVCKPIWLGLYDDRNLAIPDFRDPQKVKEFLQDKYEKKRWWETTWAEIYYIWYLTEESYIVIIITQ